MHVSKFLGPKIHLADSKLKENWVIVLWEYLIIF